MENQAIAELLGPKYQAVSHDGALAIQALGLPAGAPVLDVGTGNGSFAIFLATQGHPVVTGEPATDTSAYAGQDWQGQARLAGVQDRIRFQPFDASQLPFESGSFAAVFFCGVLHHIEDSLRPAVLREALRVAERAVVFLEPQPKLVEKIREEHPSHPPAANPADYLPDGETTRETRLQGDWLDIFIYTRS